MKKRLRTPDDLEGELKYLENSLKRIRQTFLLEKDESVKNGGEALELLREREKFFYQPAVRRMMNDHKILCYQGTRIEGIPSSIFLRLDELESGLKEARAHFTGTVNRLMRCAWLKAGDDECTE
jgi:hypothetical protein